MNEPKRSNPYLILALVAFGVFIAADDLTVVSTMLPQMIVDLDIPIRTDLDEAAWIVNSYLIAYVITMPFMGRLSDLFGRRRIFVGCLVLFAAGSLLVPLAPSLSWLIVGRVITALGGGAIVPVAIAIVGDAFPSQRRPFAMGLLGAVDTAGWIWGPLYGAMLVRYLGWRWQFYLNIPLSLASAALAFYALRDLQPPVEQQDRSLDLAGASVLTLALLALNVGLSRAGGGLGETSDFDFGNTSTTPAWVWPLIGIGLLGFGLFAWVEKRVQRPLIDLNMFRRRNFTLACCVNFIVGFVLIIAMVDVPLFINVILGENVGSAAIDAGRTLSALTVAMAIFSIVGGWLCERFGYRIPTLLGLFFCAFAFILMGTGWQTDVSYTQMAFHLALNGIGFGLVIAPTSTAVVDAVRVEHRGIASALVIVLRLMGMTVGLSALTAWGLYRFDVLGRTLPPVPLTETAQMQRLAYITARVLRETFLISGIVTIIAWVPAAWLRGRERRTSTKGP